MGSLENDDDHFRLNAIGLNWDRCDQSKNLWNSDLASVHINTWPVARIGGQEKAETID